MALPSDYRWIVIGKIMIRNRKNVSSDAPTFALSDLMSALSDRIDRNNIYRLYSNNSRVMWCAHLTEDARYYQMILQIGDKNVSGVSFFNFETTKSRDIIKREKEGSQYAAHVLVKKAPDKYGRHLMLFEKVPGIYLATIKDHLTWTCADELYEKQSTDNKGNIKSHRPVFELFGHQSRTIRDALATGTLQDIELITVRESHEDGLDEDPIIDETKHEVRWSIRRQVSEDQARRTFSRAIEYVSSLGDGSHHTQMMIRIKTSNGQMKRTQVQLDGEEILEQAFIDNEVVKDFADPLTDRYATFRTDIISKIMEIGEKQGD